MPRTVTTAGRPLSKIKKKMAPHMIVVSRDSAGGYLVTLGDPKKSSSKIKQSFHGSDAKDELLLWAKYNIGKEISEDYVIDQTGLKIAPAEYTQWYVENIMAASVTATLDDVAEELERRGKPALATKVDDVSSEMSEFKEAVGYTGDASEALRLVKRCDDALSEAAMILMQSLPDFIEGLKESGDEKSAKYHEKARSDALKAVRAALKKVEVLDAYLPRDIQKLIDAE